MQHNDLPPALALETAAAAADASKAPPIVSNRRLRWWMAQATPRSAHPQPAGAPGGSRFAGGLGLAECPPHSAEAPAGPGWAVVA